MAAASQYLKLNPSEIALFDRLFSLVEDPNTGSATGPQVSSLFLTSGLPRPTLATVWNIASAGKGGKLDKDGFFVGCKLIALAQQNLPISQESLLLHRDVPLPLFHGAAQQYYPRDSPAGMQQPGQVNMSMPGTIMQTAGMPAMPSIPQMISSAAVPANMMPGQTTPHQQSAAMNPVPQTVSTAQQTRMVPQTRATVQQPTPIADYSAISASPVSDALKSSQNRPISAASSSTTISRRPSVQTDSLWDISPEKRETYLKYFDQADADKDSFVNGKEAKTFFTMSKLSSAVLRDIWLLSDIDQDNRLNKEEFTIAMHLTMAVRMLGIPVPAQLPEPLMQYYNRQMQQQPSVNASAPTASAGPAPVPAASTVSLMQSNQQAANFAAASAVPAENSTSVRPIMTNPDFSVEKAEYTRQIASAKAQIEEQKIAIQGYQSRLPNYEEELQNLKAEAKIAESTLATLTQERKHHQTAFEKIRTEIASAKSNLDSFNGKMNEERKSINDYQEQVVQGTKKLEELRLERDQLQKSVDDLKQQVQDKELAVVCIEQEMEDVKRQICHLNEVSSYQVQILSRVSSDHEDKERQLAELLASKSKLDHAKAASTVAMPSASAPISPLKSVGTAEPVWIAPSLNNPAAVSSLLSSAIVQEEFTFPEFNDDDFSSSPLKSAPVTTATIPSIDLAKSVAPEKLINSTVAVDSFRFPSESIAHPDIFSLDNGASPFGWDPELNKSLVNSSNVSSNNFEANPFEEEDWNPPIKTMPESSPGSEKQHSASSQTQNIDSVTWPPSDFGASSVSANGDWAQF